MKKFNFKKKINILNYPKIDGKLLKNSINLIEVNYKVKPSIDKISSKSNKFIQDSFNVGLKIYDMLLSFFINTISSSLSMIFLLMWRT